MTQRSLLPTLLLLALLGGGGARTFRIQTGQYLEDLPGYTASQGLQPEAQHLDLSLVDLIVEGPANADGTALVNFTAKAYRNNRKARTRPFGPTLRVRPGTSFSIRLTNDLVAAPGEALAAGHFNHLTLPSFTNLHTHGLWGDPGLHSQLKEVTYGGHDNVFVPIAPRPNASAPHGDSITYQYSLPHNHMPGFAWYHPHMHGSSGLQTATAKGVIIVEGDEDFLPEEGGCGPLRQVLLGGGGERRAATERVLQLEGWFFGGTRTKEGQSSGGISPGSSGSGRGGGSAAEGLAKARGEELPDHDSYPDISKRSEPPNPTCCNQTEGFSSAGFDFLTVNGGYRPILRMEPGVWQRWRIIYAAYMRYVDLTWVTEAGAPAPCELQLLAKDGVFLQQIPREVSHVLLPPGGRADLLVRCSGAAGTRLTLRSGFGPLSATPSMCNQPTCKVMQQVVVATMELQQPSAAGQASLELPPEGCRPLRPPHLADLRDAALEAAGFDRSKLIRGSIMFFPATMGDMAGVCTVNGQLFSFPDSQPLLAPLGSVVEWALMQTPIHPHHLHTVPFQIVGLPDLTRGGTMRRRQLLQGRQQAQQQEEEEQQQQQAQQQQQQLFDGADMEEPGGWQPAGATGRGRRALQQAMGGSTQSHFEMMRQWGVASAAAGMTKANEDAWAKLTSYFKVGDHHDTLLLPLSAGMGAGAAMVRFQPGHHTGYSVHHCHYLQHEDMGCMKMVKWQCPGFTGDEQPEECTFDFPVKGTLPWDKDGRPTAVAGA